MPEISVANASTAELVVVEIEDWSIVYLNGELSFADHRLNPEDIGNLANGKILRLVTIWGSDQLQEIYDDQGEPSSISQLPIADQTQINEKLTQLA